MVLLLLATLATAAEHEPPAISNEKCQTCHGIKGFSVPTGAHGETRKKSLFVDEEGLQASVHGRFACLTCHKDIRTLPHVKKGGVVTVAQVDCVSCHLRLHQESDDLMAQLNAGRAMAGLVPNVAPTPVKANVATERFLDSIHAQPTREGQKTNAECKHCHGVHDVFPSHDKRATSHRLASPETCGACHEKALSFYRLSVHGAALKRPWVGETAVCSDCHSSHDIASSKQAPTRRAITQNCGTCHQEALEGYMGTYHGQLAWLGGQKVARCYDCHRAHDTRSIQDARAKVHPDSVLKTCQTCHKGASPAFTSFHPHGNTRDFDRYPAMWIVGKLMVGIVILVLIFFYSHSALWFYRSWQERKAMGNEPRIFKEEDEEKAAPKATGHVRRFSWPWRINHWVLVISVMTLVATGMTAMYSGSDWAVGMAGLFGGPERAAFIHRVAAVGFLLAVVGHFAALAYTLFYRRKTPFDWFGPDSLLPRWKDWHDMVGMFRWFFGKGPHPAFDRWTYWEKFDYWAVGWGLIIIGISGMILWFSPFFSQFLPGWAFNVATIAHGMEAFLAVATLFTVHFFNNHFRPGKFPLDIVMFVGSWSIAEFKEERPEAYRRMVEDGTLKTRLVPPPSPRAVQLSHWAGFFLLGVGLSLLLLVAVGFVRQGLF